MKLNSGARIDPELRAELEGASSKTDPIAAVIKLRSDSPRHDSLPPEETERVTERILARVRQRAGDREHEYYVLDMLGAFNLVAPAHFVVELLKQPEVASAMAAERENTAYIPPRNIKEVRLPFKLRR
jgi:hypothetical protein